MDREELVRIGLHAVDTAIFSPRIEALPRPAREAIVRAVVGAVLPAIEDQWEQVGWLGYGLLHKERPFPDATPMFRRRSPETRGDKDRGRN